MRMIRKIGFLLEEGGYPVTEQEIREAIGKPKKPELSAFTCPYCLRTVKVKNSNLRATCARPSCRREHKNSYNKKFNGKRKVKGEPWGGHPPKITKEAPIISKREISYFDKPPTREEIQYAVQQYLRRGGAIKQLPTSPAIKVREEEIFSFSED